MKTRIYLLVLMLSVALSIHAQSYNKLWKDVEQMEQNDLPKSVLAKAKIIYEKAKTDRNVPQMMKAYLTMMIWKRNISPDSLQIDINDLEEWAMRKDTEAQDKAVLNSILGGIFIEKDFEKGNRFLLLSLKDSLNLIEYKAENLAPLVKTEETSLLYFDDNLYDLLARRAIRLWEQHQWNRQQTTIQETIKKTYHSLLHIYQVKGMRSAWLLTALDAYPQADEKCLRTWIKEYGDLDICAEVYLRLATNRLYQDKPAERLAILREGIARYPDYSRINVLKNAEHEILTPTLNLFVARTCPKIPIDVRIDYRNLKGVTLKLYRVNLSIESVLLKKLTPKTVAEYASLVREKHIDLPTTFDYKMRTDTLILEEADAGVYYVVGIPDGYPKIERGILLYITGLQIIHRTLPDNKQEVIVLNKWSGHPVPEAQVNIYQRKGEDYVWRESHIANSDGVVVLPIPQSLKNYMSFQAQTTADKAMPIVDVWLGNNQYRTNDIVEEHVKLFTDRSIYRPGQNLHYSGIVYHQQKDETKVSEENNYPVILQDADGKEVLRQEVKTDSFGSFSGVFKLPKMSKMGVYRLLVGKGITSFQVEEYNHPTFEVSFDTVRSNYQAGDSIQVIGRVRSFSGMPVQEALVNYQVSRLENKFWRIRGIETKQSVGETITDTEGKFEVPLYFSPMEEGNENWHYIYKVSVDVTSLSGETQKGILSLPLGSSSLKLFIPDWENETILKEHNKQLTFQVNNLMGVPIKVEVDYQVWLRDELMLQGKAISNEDFELEGLDDLPSGRYRLKAMLKDEAGEKVEQTVMFSLFSLKDKCLPDDMPLWCYQSSEEFGSDGTATLYLGSSKKDVYLFCDLMYGDNRVERKRIVFSDSLLTFRYTYREEYGDGLRCSFAFLKDGELYSRNFIFNKPKPDKTLCLRWKTFRDKLQPGANEFWTLSILHPDGKPAEAQLLATMYDASLDRLAPHTWDFDLNFVRNIPRSNWQFVDTPHAYWGFDFPMKMLKFNPFSYSRLEIPFGLASEERGMQMFKSNVAMGNVKSAMGLALRESASIHDVSILDTSLEQGVNENTGKVQIRTNFGETVFFYPQLRTNEKGEVNIEFHLPESLTEWKFMGLAHTKDLDFGSLTEKVVASKKFMLQPNLPRYVRVGDQVNVASLLMNLSDKEVKGMVRMELFLPDSDKVILWQKTPFVVKAGETEKISFSFTVTDNYEGLGVRMIADGDNFSDGEQRYLPVLTNKQTLTESILLNTHGKGTFTYSLDTLFNNHSTSISHPRMWVEYASNPMWYAILALKVVSNPENDNVLSWASAYYANSLLVHLVKIEPRIIDSLKLDYLDTKLEEARLKLKELQNEDGSWSWYKGMSGSFYMTTSVVQLLTRLQQISGGGLDADCLKMKQQAWGYLNKQLAEEVRIMKENERKGIKNMDISNVVLQCLYSDALSNYTYISEEIANYLISKLESMSARLTIYGKALSSIIFYEAGKDNKAKEFIESLMQYSVMTEEMGRYFDSDKASYSWFSYKIPTQVAAIEAIKRVTNEAKTQEEMKQWLLKQKQTQVWDTPVATTDAVYALLTTGENWLLGKGEGEIEIGDEKIRIREGESLGYLNEQVQGDVMKLRKVTLQRSSAGIGWGSVYTEFEEEIDKVSAQGNALKVIRKLYKDGKPLLDGDVLRVGDRLTVCLIIITDRDMDFVQVKDERAACMESSDALSGYRWNGQIGYYQELKDSSIAFYLEKMRKGIHRLSYDVYVAQSGVYQQGIATIKSLYAPEFAGHGQGGCLVVK